MEPQMKIDIVDSDYPRLQLLAVPFVDSPASVITKLLDEKLAGQGVASKPIRGVRAGVYSLEALPPLTHAKIMGGHFASRPPEKSNWDGFVRAALTAVLTAVGSVDELRRISGAHVREGKFDKHGFKHVPEHDFSFQGVSATDAIQIIARCARHMKLPFQIEFVWRERPDAFAPGERGVIQFEAQ
jgi:hypothetical protein